MDERYIESYILSAEDVEAQRLATRIQELSLLEQETATTNADKTLRRWWFHYEEKGSNNGT